MAVNMGENCRLAKCLILATILLWLSGLTACGSDPTMAPTRVTAAPAAPTAATSATPMATAMVSTATATPTTAPALPSTPAQTDGLIPAAGSVSALTFTFQGREFRLAQTKI